MEHTRDPRSVHSDHRGRMDFAETQTDGMILVGEN
jgi:hypothetical protein